MEEQVTIFLVDDEPEVTAATRWLLHSVGLEATTFNDPALFLDAIAAETGPACVLLDLRMPERSGLEIMEHITRLRPDIAILFLSAHGDIPSAIRAIKMGAVDFLQKPCNPHDLLEHIGRLCRLARERHAARSVRTGIEQRLAALSPRERQVLRRMLHGESSKEIGRVLAISPKTVDVHRASILRKLEVASSREAVQRFRDVVI